MDCFVNNLLLKAVYMRRKFLEFLRVFNHISNGYIACSILIEHFIHYFSILIESLDRQFIVVPMDNNY